MWYHSFSMTVLFLQLISFTVVWDVLAERPRLELKKGHVGKSQWRCIKEHVCVYLTAYVI